MAQETLSPEAIADLRIAMDADVRADLSSRFTDAELTHLGLFLLEVYVQGQNTRKKIALEEMQSRNEPSFPAPAPSYAMDMARRLKEAREARGLTQLELAKLIGLSSNNRISRWEQGLAMPSVENAVKLERVLRVNIDSLFKKN